MSAVPAFDEGGNFIDVRFGPLTLINPSTGLLYGNYHIGPTSPARGVGIGNTEPLLSTDFDVEARNRGVNRPGEDRASGDKDEAEADATTAHLIQLSCVEDSMGLALRLDEAAAAAPTS